MRDVMLLTKIIMGVVKSCGARYDLDVMKLSNLSREVCNFMMWRRGWTWKPKYMIKLLEVISKFTKADYVLGRDSLKQTCLVSTKTSRRFNPFGHNTKHIQNQQSLTLVIHLRHPGVWMWYIMLVYRLVLFLGYTHHILYTWCILDYVHTIRIHCIAIDFHEINQEVFCLRTSL